LLVSENEYDGVPHFPVVYDPVQFLPRLVYPVTVGAVHDEDEPLRPGVVVAPERPDFVLTTDVLKMEKIRKTNAKLRKCECYTCSLTFVAYSTVGVQSR
jgi:hypothetical protein